MATDPMRILAAAALALGALAPAGARADDAKGETPRPPAQPGPPADPAPAAKAAPPGDAAAGDASVEKAVEALTDRPTRRGGFMIGLDAGGGLASLVGYPNDVTKIGLLSGYSGTGVRPATTVEAWIGGAFTDWFSFGLGFTSSTMFATGDSKAKMTGGMFRIEAFPLFSQGRGWRDLGVRFDAGLGVGTLTDSTGFKVVDSSSASIIGGGVFWEGLRAWKTAHGPMLMGNYLFSDSARRPAIFFGWRSVLYTSP